MRKLALSGFFCLAALLTAGCDGDSPKAAAADLAVRTEEPTTTTGPTVKKGKAKTERARTATRPSFQINPNL